MTKGRGRSSRYGSVPIMHRSGRCCVLELQDGIGNPAPGHGAVVIAFGRESSARVPLCLSAFSP
jgi:hypothetical protein